MRLRRIPGVPNDEDQVYTVCSVDGYAWKTLPFLNMFVYDGIEDDDIPITERMLLDTGASISCMPTSLVPERLRRQIQQVDVGESRQFLTANGPSYTNRYIIRRIAITKGRVVEVPFWIVDRLDSVLVSWTDMQRLQIRLVLPSPIAHVDAEVYTEIKHASSSSADIPVSDVKVRKQFLSGIDKAIKRNAKMKLRGQPCNHELATYKANFIDGVTSDQMKSSSYPYPRAQAKLIDDNKAVEIANGWLKRVRKGHSKSTLQCEARYVVAGTPDKPRVCFNAVSFNHCLKDTKAHIPKISDIFSSIRDGENIYMSKIDLSKAYFAIPWHKDQFGLLYTYYKGKKYAYTRTPFGIRDLPNHFVAMMNSIFGNIPGVLVYFDDIFIYSKTLKEHIRLVNRVIELCTRYNLPINADKCRFCYESVEYLGMKISRDGISPSPEKVNGIMEIEVKPLKKDVLRFLGMVNFHRSFIPNIATLCEPIYRILKDNKKKNVIDDEAIPVLNAAVEELKIALQKAISLSFLPHDADMAVFTDASDIAYGAVLGYYKNNDMSSFKPVATISKKFKDFELNWSLPRKELAAVVKALVQWEQFLLGTPFIVITDHKALIWQLADLEKIPRVINVWALTLSRFKFSVQHIAGEKNLFADILSRAPGGDKVSKDLTAMVYKHDRHDVGLHESNSLQTDSVNVIKPFRPSIHVNMEQVMALWSAYDSAIDTDNLEWDTYVMNRQRMERDQQQLEKAFSDYYLYELNETDGSVDAQFDYNPNDLKYIHIPQIGPKDDYLHSFAHSDTYHELITVDEVTIDKTIPIVQLNFLRCNDKVFSINMLSDKHHVNEDVVSQQLREADSLMAEPIAITKAVAKAEGVTEDDIEGDTEGDAVDISIGFDPSKFRDFADEQLKDSYKATLSSFGKYNDEFVTTVERAIINSREALKKEVLSRNQGQVMSVSNVNAVAEVQNKRRINRKLLAEIANTKFDIGNRKGRMALLKRLHEVGHESATRLVDRARALQFNWSSIHADAAEVAGVCSSCLNGNYTRRMYVKSASIRATCPFDWVQVDVYHPGGLSMIGDEAYKYVLCYVDVFSGFTILHPLKSTTARETNQAIRSIVHRFGLPRMIQSDGGPEFSGIEQGIKDAVEVWGCDVKNIKSAPHDHQSNGRVERTIKEVRLLTNKFCYEYDPSVPHKERIMFWTDVLNEVEFAINTRVHPINKLSPFQLVFNRLPNGLLFENYLDFTPDINLASYLDDALHHAEIIHSTLRVRDEQYEKQKKMMDERNKVREPLPVGSVVYWHNPSSIKYSLWEGPYYVASHGKHNRHVLKKIIFGLDEAEQKVAISETFEAPIHQLKWAQHLTVKDFEEWVEYHKIVGHKDVKGKRYYKFRFAFTSPLFDQFLTEEDLGSRHIVAYEKTLADLA